MTLWDFLDKHSKAAGSLIRLALMGIMYASFANDLSLDEMRYMLLAGGGEILTSRLPKGE